MQKVEELQKHRIYLLPEMVDPMGWVDHAMERLNSPLETHAHDLINISSLSPSYGAISERVHKNIDTYPPTPTALIIYNIEDNLPPHPMAYEMLNALLSAASMSHVFVAVFVNKEQFYEGMKKTSNVTIAELQKHFISCSFDEEERILAKAKQKTMLNADQRFSVSEFLRNRFEIIDSVETLARTIAFQTELTKERLISETNHAAHYGLDHAVSTKRIKFKMGVTP